METVAIHASEESTQILKRVEVSTLSFAVQQLIINNDLHGIHQDPLGEWIAIDTEGKRYPAKD
jgi:hypothetical protein